MDSETSNHHQRFTRDSHLQRRQGAAAFRAPKSAGREVQRDNRRPRAASATPKDVPKGDSKAGWHFASVFSWERFWNRELIVEPKLQ